ncbi:MAG: glycosyltransferase [Bacteroidota bacterium]
MRLIALGPLWRGSNAGGLFRALSRQGCHIEVIDEFYHISLQTREKLNKVVERVIRPLQVKEYNNTIKKKISVFMPDVVLVYKGTFVKPETLAFARQKGCKIVLFYPDVSMTAHGGNIPKAIPMYDLIFTTKTFGITDMKDAYGATNTHFIPHGFDPEIHRPLTVTKEERELFTCDASFIGTWSPKKEKMLAYLKENVPGINLKIWGERWNEATTASIGPCIQRRAILGDLYTLAIQCSKINLGILSEQVSGASSGDLITSRTFHIPGASGFMLHERNEESVLYYKENDEAAFFDGAAELAAKVQHFLENDALRDKIRLAGYQRALLDHSLDARAKAVIGKMKTLL